ncbi:hypothetical protein ACJJTC_019174 [Scirpophaga incertulas]
MAVAGEKCVLRLVGFADLASGLASYTVKAGEWWQLRPQPFLRGCEASLLGKLLQFAWDQQPELKAARIAGRTGEICMKPIGIFQSAACAGRGFQHAPTGGRRRAGSRRAHARGPLPAREFSSERDVRDARECTVMNAVDTKLLDLIF